MSRTLRSMSLGDVLVFGQYTAFGGDATPAPLRWLKATPNCDFISEGVVDICVLDATEEWPGDFRPDGWYEIGSGYEYDGSGENRVLRRGNPHFEVSTLLQYLNSAKDGWYSPQHKYDAPPARQYLPSMSDQSQHAGFLRYFDSYEIAALLEKTTKLDTGEFTSLVRIPTVKDMYGDNDRLNLFKKRRGVRAHPTQDLAKKLLGTTRMADGDRYYLSYFLADMGKRFRGSNATVDKSSYLGSAMASEFRGVRPLVSLNPKSRVEQIGDKEYRILPKGVKEMRPSTTEEMFAFFGMAQP